MPESQYTRINLLWAYRHPHLAQRSIDRLFEEWGNRGIYSWKQLIPFEFELHVTQVGLGTSLSPMLEVIRAKHDMEVALAMAVEEFVEDNRGRWSEDTWKMYDQERSQSVAELADEREEEFA